MRIASTEEQQAWIPGRATRKVEFDGFTIHYNPVDLGTGDTCRKAISEALGSLPLSLGEAQGMDEKTAAAKADEDPNLLEASSLAYYAIFGLALDDPRLRLETPEIDDPAALSAQDWLAYGQMVRRELSTKAARREVSFPEVREVAQVALNYQARVAKAGNG